MTEIWTSDIECSLFESVVCHKAKQAEVLSHTSMFVRYISVQITIQQMEPLNLWLSFNMGLQGHIHKNSYQPVTLF